MLVLLDYIIGLIKDSKSVEEAYMKVLRVRARLAELAMDQLMRELGL